MALVNPKQLQARVQHAAHLTARPLPAVLQMAERQLAVHPMVRQQLVERISKNSLIAYVRALRRLGRGAFSKRE